MEISKNMEAALNKQINAERELIPRFEKKIRRCKHVRDQSVFNANMPVLSHA